MASMKTNTNKQPKTKLTPALILGLLASMTVAELNAVAERLNVKTGKKRSDTEKNLVKAIEKNDIKFTTQFYFNTKPQSEFDLGKRVYQRKIRNHKPDVISIPAPSAETNVLLVPVGDEDDNG